MRTYKRLRYFDDLAIFATQSEKSLANVKLFAEKLLMELSSVCFTKFTTRGYFSSAFGWPSIQQLFQLFAGFDIDSILFGSQHRRIIFCGNQGLIVVPNTLPTCK